MRLSVTDSDGVSLMRSGAAAISHWRAMNPSSRILAAGGEFNGLDLSGANLAGADLRRCHFAKCDLRQANFTGAVLTDARFAYCDLSGTTFSTAELRRTAFDEVKVDGAVFTGARSIGRLSMLRLSAPPVMQPTYDRAPSAFIDRWLGWDRLRFLATIRIFVPAYTSLALSVLYLNAVAWYNDGVAHFNASVSQAHRRGEAAVACCRLSKLDTCRGGRQLSFARGCRDRVSWLPGPRG